MRSVRLIITVSLIALLSGCLRSPECDWTRTIPLGSQSSVDWLIENDRQLLVDVTTHNEVRDRLCQ